MSDEIVVGIDLGTTFSAIAYVNKHGQPELIPNLEGDRTTPSVVFFDEDGSPIIGREARNQAIVDPRRTVRFVKREMGDPSFRFNVGGKDYFPEDLSAMILKKLKSDAEEFLGQEVEKAVISVPAYFKDAQREATRQAGQIAGLEVVHIVNEPTAAALAYGVGKSKQDQKIMVYDFGGGTFDVTIMDAKDKTFTVLATDGDSKLGGKDIDACLVEYLAEEFLREHGVDLRLEPFTHQDLWDRAENAKRDLSFRENLSTTLSSGEKTLRVDIDRDEFNDLIKDIVAQTEECMTRVVDAAGMTWGDIDTLLLSGGSSRIPAVGEMIRRITGKDVARDMNPDESVAMGAAIQAVLAVSETGAGGAGVQVLDGGEDIVVRDVASHSLGVKAMAPDKSKFVNSVIIPRFTPVPCTRTRTFSTHEDDQEKVVIEVLQGENEDPRSPDVDLVGKLSLRNLPKHTAGDLIIEVSLAYDEDGVIEVIAKELLSGQTSREIVMRKSGALAQEIIEEKQREIEETDL